MINENTQPSSTPDLASPNAARPQTLQDLAVKYDMVAMAKQAEEEFDIKIATRELVDQKSISTLFNIKEKLDARN